MAAIMTSRILIDVVEIYHDHADMFAVLEKMPKGPAIIHSCNPVMVNPTNATAIHASRIRNIGLVVRLFELLVVNPWIFITLFHINVAT